jgi:hypothetical protein
LAFWRLIGTHVPAIAEHRLRYTGAAATLAVICVMNVPSHASLRTQRELDKRRAAAIELVGAASGRVDVDTVLYRPPPNYDVFGVPLLASLQSSGIGFVVDDPVLVRQFGERRRSHSEPIAELRVVTAMEAVDAERDPSTIAFVSDVSESERAELQASAIAIETWLSEGLIALSDAGRTAVESGFGDPWLDQLGDPELDATSVSRSIALAGAVQSGLLDADSEVLSTLRRYADLRLQVETSTVAVLLVH